MAQLELQEQVLFPGVVGVLSGSGDLLEKNAVAVAQAQGRKANVLMRNAGAVADYGLGAYAVINHMGDFGFPRRGSSELAASGVTVVTQRATKQIGDVILGLTRSVSKTPAGSRHGVGARMRSSNGVPTPAASAAFSGMDLEDEVLVTQI